MVSFVDECPTWAFDPRNRTDRPRTGGRWQPVWDPIQGREPMPGYETFVAQLLTYFRIRWIYEPLLMPINRHARQPDPNMRRRPRKRRLVRNDFYLPDYELMIEVYSGHSDITKNAKRRHLERISRTHRLAVLLLTPTEQALLERDPSHLLALIHQAHKQKAR